jgi:hypothetical protein
VSRNRSFVDFGRNRLVDDDIDEIWRDAFSHPLDPTGEPFAEMLQRLRTHLNQNYPSGHVVSFGTPRMAYDPFARFLGIESNTPDYIAEAALESHAPQAEERPLTRKESFAAWQKRSAALIDEHRRGHE